MLVLADSGSTSLRKSLRRASAWRRPIGGVAALLCFIATTLVAPAGHIYNHWNDHIHTATGLVFTDGHLEEEQPPASLQALLDGIHDAAFGEDTVPNETAAAAARFSGSARCDAGLPSTLPGAAHGSGSSLHFGLVFQVAVPVLDPLLCLTRLRVLVACERFITPGRLHVSQPKIRGPPAQA